MDLHSRSCEAILKFWYWQIVCKWHSYAEEWRYKCQELGLTDLQVKEYIQAILLEEIIREPVSLSREGDFNDRRLRPFTCAPELLLEL